MRRGIAPAALVAMLLVPGASGAAAATLEPDTLEAWDAWVARTEARQARKEDAWPMPATATCFLDAGDGDSTGVPGGTITRWRGAVLVPGVTLDALLDRLEHPDEHGPHQEDVLALRVLERQPGALRLFIRITRRAIVRVTYDTEHIVTFTRLGPDHALGRSASTRIVEVTGAGSTGEHVLPHGEDRGLLWRMHAYWRYTQTPTGVLVELESLTLSRAIPFGLGPIVRPLIDRIARDSVRRTLDTLRRAHRAAPAPGCA